MTDLTPPSDDLQLFAQPFRTLADQLDGALSPVEASLGITDAELQDRFRAWWQQSYPTPPGPHAVMTHVSWARHLLELDKQRQS